MPTHREKFLKRHNLPKDTTLSLPEIAKLAKMPLAALEEVEKRGAGAWKTNPESVRVQGTFAKNPSLKAVPRSGRLSQAQWARARVYSFVERGRTFKTADKDIALKYNIK